MPLFIAYVAACIAMSLVVFVFFLKNKSDTDIDRQCGLAVQREGEILCVTSALRCSGERQFSAWLP